MEFTLRETNLQIVGNSHYCTLPIEWIRHHKLKKGKKVRITLDDSGRLVISPVVEVAD